MPQSIKVNETIKEERERKKEKIPTSKKVHFWNIFSYSPPSLSQMSGNKKQNRQRVFAVKLKKNIFHISGLLSSSIICCFLPESWGKTSSWIIRKKIYIVNIVSDILI